MKLYTFFRSSASFRVRIALNLKGIAWESVPVNLPKSEHVEARFKAINPQGLVPALDDSGRLVGLHLRVSGQSINASESTSPISWASGIPSLSKSDGRRSSESGTVSRSVSGVPAAGR